MAYRGKNICRAAQYFFHRMGSLLWYVAIILLWNWNRFNARGNHEFLALFFCEDILILSGIVLYKGCSYFFCYFKTEVFSQHEPCLRVYGRN